jgi:hypothetical protein
VIGSIELVVYSIVGILVGVGVLVFLLRLQAKSDAQVAAVYRKTADELGLRYVPHGAAGTAELDPRRLPLELFHVGADRSGFGEGLVGTWNGRPVRIFTYSTRLGTGREAATHWFSCGVTDLPKQCPAVIITPSDGFSALLSRDYTLHPRIPTVADEFDARFVVHSPDRRFASAVLDEDMMAWLIDGTSGTYFEVGGSCALVVSKDLLPWVANYLVVALDGFVTRISSVAYDAASGKT